VDFAFVVKPKTCAHLPRPQYMNNPRFMEEEDIEAARAFEDKRAKTAINKPESDISLKYFSLFMDEISSVVTHLCASWPVTGEHKKKGYEQQQHKHESSFAAYERKTPCIPGCSKNALDECKEITKNFHGLI